MKPRNSEIQLCDVPQGGTRQDGRGLDHWRNIWHAWALRIWTAMSCEAVRGCSILGHGRLGYVRCHCESIRSPQGDDLSDGSSFS